MLVLDQVVPVPLGHRVRVQQLRGGGAAENDAIVVDLDSGIEYVPARDAPPVPRH